MMYLFGKSVFKQIFIARAIYIALIYLFVIISHFTVVTY